MGGIVTRMRELAVQSRTKVPWTQRNVVTYSKNLTSCVRADRIVNVTEYNGQKLVDGTISAGIDFK